MKSPMEELRPLFDKDNVQAQEISTEISFRYRDWHLFCSTRSKKNSKFNFVLADSWPNLKETENLFQQKTIDDE